MSTASVYPGTANGTGTHAPLLRSALLGGVPGVVHGFTTRHGGVSTGQLASLNLGPRPGESEEVRVENWRRVCGALGDGLTPASLALVHQVHGVEVAVVEEPGGPSEVMAEADALVTTAIGVVLAVRTADCVPVLLAAPGAVAAVHSGWRGTVAGVVPAAVALLCELARCAPGEVTAAVGPAISAAAYEVGPEVVQGLAGAGLSEQSFLQTRFPGRPHVDLPGAIRAQLEGVGVNRCEVLAACTHTDPRFYSHRRDGAGTGRQAAVIARWP